MSADEQTDNSRYGTVQLPSTDSETESSSQCSEREVETRDVATQTPNFQEYWVTTGEPGPSSSGLRQICPAMQEIIREPVPYMPELRLPPSTRVLIHEGLTFYVNYLNTESDDENVGDGEEVDEDEEYEEDEGEEVEVEDETEEEEEVGEELDEEEEVIREKLSEEEAAEIEEAAENEEEPEKEEAAEKEDGAEVEEKEN